MNIGVIGSRSFNNYEQLKNELNSIDVEISTIISGGANGADKLAEIYANEYNIKTTIFYPDWSIGKCAAAIRNKQIVENSNMILAFWDGTSPGTKMTIKMATDLKKPVKIVYY